MPDVQIQSKLPENAYRELKPGETYVPMVPAGARAPELTLRSVIFGILMNVLFSAAATYLALKVGQGIETAIPISILAVGLSGLLLKIGLRQSSIIENINILAISTTSGMVAGGTVFTMPAIYLLELNTKLNMSNSLIFLHIFLVPFFGAILGVIFLVPFRRYFVKEMHGKLPFPEGTATNEILVTGESGGKGAIVLVYSFLLAAVYTFLSQGMRLFTDIFTTGNIAIEWFRKSDAVQTATQAAAGASKWVSQTTETLAFAESKFWVRMTEEIKAVISLGTGAEFLGLGFIIGVRYASIIMAGSLLSFLVIVPMLGPLSLEALQAINPAARGVSAEAIFRAVPRNIGIGCIFTAGLLSILKMSPVIVTALREALGSLFRKHGPIEIDRTDRDMSYPTIFGLGILVTIAIAVYFRFLVLDTVENANALTAVATLLALGVSFVFITVSAWAIATISVTPISGMTVTTIIITAVALLAAGLTKGPAGQLAVLLVGGVVASSLSVAGTLVTEFKLGYWAGATPARIQWSALIACVLASLCVTGTIMLLAKQVGFDPDVNPGALPAPQANLMRGALESFLGTGQVPWLVYGVGVIIALALQLLNVSPLAFGLGMYLPMELNLPILIGAWVAALVGFGTKREATKKARNDRGIIIASGLIAGGAIAGVVIKGLVAWQGTEGLIRSIDRVWVLSNRGIAPETVAQQSNLWGLIAFLVLCAFVLWDSRRGRPEHEQP